MTIASGQWRPQRTIPPNGDMTMAKKATTKKAATKTTTQSTSKSSAMTTKKAPATKKMSMLDAAVKVLEKSNDPMNSKAIIDEMASKKLWTSPNGKTPHATLYAALLREINKKGNESRFKKVDKGLFATNN